MKVLIFWSIFHKLPSFGRWELSVLFSVVLPCTRTSKEPDVSRPHLPTVMTRKCNICHVNIFQNPHTDKNSQRFLVNNTENLYKQTYKLLKRYIMSTKSSLIGLVSLRIQFVFRRYRVDEYDCFREGYNPVTTFGENCSYSCWNLGDFRLNTGFPYIHFAFGSLETDIFMKWPWSVKSKIKRANNLVFGNCSLVSISIPLTGVSPLISWINNNYFIWKKRFTNTSFLYDNV